MRHLRRLFLLAAACLLSVGTVSAQGYPTRTVRIIVPFAAGGTEDVLARLLSEQMTLQMKQPVIVENRPGSGGDLGADLLAKSAPDGYTLGILSGTHTANAAFHRNVPFRLDTDFVPVKALGDSATLLAVSPDAPFKSVPALLAYARTHPDRVLVASTSRLAVDLLEVQGGIDVEVVCCGPVDEALRDLMSHRVDVVAGPAHKIIPLVQQGRVLALGRVGSQSIPELPGVAGVAESIPGYDAGSWYGLFAPAGTPASVIQALNRASTNALAMPDVQRRLREQGIDAGSSGATSEMIRTRMQREVAQWRRVAAQMGYPAN